jgi:4-hydroxythreonine-4-phosphate dehydrogenase
MGDPGGIGPEVLCKALADENLRNAARWLIAGAPDATGWKPEPSWNVRVIREGDTQSPSNTPHVERGSITLVDLGHRAANHWPAHANAEAGEASFQFVERAIAWAQRPKSLAADPWRADAVVTAPINKEAWSLAGHKQYPGHTELFAERFNASRFAMMFHAPPAADDRPGRLSAGLNVILATVHCPLREVASRLTTQRILDTIELGAAAMQRLASSPHLSPLRGEVASLRAGEGSSSSSPRIGARVGVCGLNPHAGEHGLLGHEDAAIIAPAVAAARALGLDAHGPLPADTIFQSALAFPNARPRSFDLVVAMYHDQGLIPLKTIAWDRAVNMTVGLSIPRTSPDHGTAFDIAGKDLADAGSMKAAMELAVKMARTDS